MKEKLIELIEQAKYCSAEELADYLLEAGLVLSVRCKNCTYWQDNNGGYPHDECRWRYDETPDADDFCSFGEKGKTIGELIDGILKMRKEMGWDEIEFDYNAED